METGDTRNGRPQSTVYHDDCAARRRSDHKQFEPERFTDPEIWKFLENVKVEHNAELSALYPDAAANIVHVDLADGRRLTKRVYYPLGHAKNPLKDSEVEAKFFTLVNRRLGETRAKKIVDLVWRLDEPPTVDEL